MGQIMTKNILVATDLSARSDRAVHRAAQLARAHGARLTILHVLDDAMPDKLLAEQQAAVAEYLDEYATTVAAGLDCTVLPCVGDPASMILDQVQDQNPSLLVIGTHRERRFLDAIRETTAQRVVRLTGYPVLVVSGPADQDYASVLAATDFSPASTAALNLGHALAPTATITPLHAVHVPYAGRLAGSEEAVQDLSASFLTEAKEADDAWRAKTALPVTLHHTEFPTGSALSALKRKAAAKRGTLITAGAHGRTGAHRALLGSVATDLLRDPPCDVLIARPNGG